MDEVCPSLFDDILEGISNSKGVKENAGDEGISLGEEEPCRQHRSASIVHFAMMDKTRQIEGEISYFKGVLLLEKVMKII